MVMRVITGSARGRKLQSPGEATRPMTERVREALFSIIGSEVTGARVLDLFGGSASLSCEALSRGADWATVVDRSADAISAARKNLSLCEFLARSETVRSDVMTFARRLGHDQTYDLVFVDPPYADGDETIQDLLEVVAQLIEPGALVILHRPFVGKGEDRRFTWPSGYRLEDERTYGGTMLCFARYVGKIHDRVRIPGDRGRR